MASCFENCSDRENDVRQIFFSVNAHVMKLPSTKIVYLNKDNKTSFIIGTSWLIRRKIISHEQKMKGDNNQQKVMEFRVSRRRIFEVDVRLMVMKNEVKFVMPLIGKVIWALLKLVKCRSATKTIMKTDRKI